MLLTKLPLARPQSPKNADTEAPDQNETNKGTFYWSKAATTHNRQTLVSSLRPRLSSSLDGFGANEWELALTREQPLPSDTTDSDDSSAVSSLRNLRKKSSNKTLNDKWTLVSRCTSRLSKLDSFVSWVYVYLEDWSTRKFVWLGYGVVYVEVQLTWCVSSWCFRKKVIHVACSFY